MPRKPEQFADHPAPFPIAPQYRAHCTHVVDGDTIDVMVDLGLHHYAYTTIRIAGIDTSEIFRPKNEAEKQHGLEAKTFLETLVLDKPVKIVTRKDSTSFGRYVADVWCVAPDGMVPARLDVMRDDAGVFWLNVAKVLIDAGFEKRDA